MSRVSSLVFGSVVAAIGLMAMGCQVEASIKTKTRFTEPKVDPKLEREDVADWDGSPIVIDIDGVGFASNGGVNVTSDPNATKVKATARMLARAISEEKDNADLSIAEAKNTFTITRSNGNLTVACRHGGSHGSSSAGESGCELVEIVIPAGSAEKPLDLKVLSGNGGINLQLSNATIKRLGTNSNGGDTNADVPATKDGEISLVSEKADDITVKLPSSFAADEVILQADSDKIELGPYTDIKEGAGAGGRGQAGTGLKLLKLTSKAFPEDMGTGKIVLR